MKKQLIPFLLIVLMSMFGAKSFAYDIAVSNADGKTIYYKWINGYRELAVSSSLPDNEYTGDVTIPECRIYSQNNPGSIYLLF